MTKIPAARICIACQAIAFLIPLAMMFSGHKDMITSKIFGFCLAIAAFSKAIEGILRKNTNISIFKFTTEEGIGDYWLGVLFWVGFGLFGVYFAVR